MIVFEGTRPCFDQGQNHFNLLLSQAWLFSVLNQLTKHLPRSEHICNPQPKRSDPVIGAATPLTGRPLGFDGELVDPSMPMDSWLNRVKPFPSTPIFWIWRWSVYADQGGSFCKIQGSSCRPWVAAVFEMLCNMLGNSVLRGDEISAAFMSVYHDSIFNETLQDITSNIWMPNALQAYSGYSQKIDINICSTTCSIFILALDTCMRSCNFSFFWAN